MNATLKRHKELWNRLTPLWRQSYREAATLSAVTAVGIATHVCLLTDALMGRYPTITQ